MRYQASEMRRQIFELLGAEPVRAPFGDLYGLLETGTVDGQENSLSNIESKRFYDVQRYLTLSNHQYLGYVVLADHRWWDGLADADRVLLEEALSDTTDWLRENALRINAEALDTIRASNTVEIYELTPDEQKAWQDAMEPLYTGMDRWLPADLAEMVRALRVDQG